MCCRKICQYFFWNKKITPASEISKSTKEKQVNNHEEPKSDKKAEFIDKKPSYFPSEKALKEEIEHIGSSKKIITKKVLEHKEERKEILDYSEEIPSQKIIDPNTEKTLIQKKLNLINEEPNNINYCQENLEKEKKKLENDKMIEKNQEIPLISKSSSLSYVFDDLKI